MIKKGLWINLLTILLMFFAFCGCVKQENTPDSKIELWVITEASCSDGMNLQAEMIAERMESEYPGLTIQLDILPTEGETRDILLKQLRTQIMSGNGPDVYLLPVGNIITTDRSHYKVRETVSTTVEPLFFDVTQAMYNGVFLDISEFYDADDLLGKNALKNEIMDAGVIEDGRYVLPLRYDMPILLSAAESMPDTRISTLVNSALEQNNIMMAIGLRMPDTLQLLPTLFDYEKGELLLTAEEIANYMELYQLWTSEAAKPTIEKLENLEYINSLRIMENFRELEMPELDVGSFNRIRDYIFYEIYWYTEGFPLYATRMSDSLHSAAIAKVVSHDLNMYPLKTTDGDTIAEVTYYGAIGSSCRNPEIAYNFLRQFLTEEFQWEIYRPRGEKDYSIASMWQYVEVQTQGFVENSFPVRVVGSVPYLWDILAYQESGMYSSFLSGSIQNSRAFQNKEIILKDSDIPALGFSIDDVRFPIVQPGGESLADALALLNEEDGTPTDVDIDELAQEVYQSLWWHLAEG